MKRAYKISIERRPNSQYLRPERYSYTVIAGNAEDAIKKTRSAAAKDTGLAHPWFIVELQEIGEAI